MNDDELTEFISGSVISKACHFSSEDITTQLSKWKDAGASIAQSLGFGDDLTDVQQQRIFQYYLPIYFWARAQLADHKAAAVAGPLVLGISAPQGCGKTTIVAELEQLFRQAGNACASVSIDDFYLSHAAQAKVSAEHPDNRLLQGRGNAGTHDLALGANTLTKLRKLGDGETMQVPRYNKSAFSGAGDTADPETWPCVSGALDIVLFEGWMLGFSSVGASKAAEVEDTLGVVDVLLAEYKEAWDSHVHAWLVVQVADPKAVFQWRLQAEQQMRAAGLAGMSDDQVQDFVSRYMPAYKAYLPRLYAEGPTTVQPGRLLRVAVNETRALESAVAA